MRGPNTTLDILFHRNDPKPLKGKHGHPNPFVTSRKPDLPFVSLQAAKRIAGLEDSNESWDTITAIYAAVAPTEAFKWYEILAPVEPKYEINLPAPSGNLLDEMPPQGYVNALVKSNKRAVSSETPQFAPSTKRQKIDGG